MKSNKQGNKQLFLNALTELSREYDLELRPVCVQHYTRDRAAFEVVPAVPGTLDFCCYDINEEGFVEWM